MYMCVCHSHTHTHTNSLGNFFSLKLYKAKNLTGVNYWKEGQIESVKSTHFKFILNKRDFPSTLWISK